MLTSQNYRRNVPYESDEWATSDRGWLYDPEHPDRDRSYNGNLPVGNYLDYGPCGDHYLEKPGGAVHACYTPWYVDECTGCIVHLPTVASWHRTTAEAKAWIEEKHTGQLSLGLQTERERKEREERES